MIDFFLGVLSLPLYNNKMAQIYSDPVNQTLISYPWSSNVNVPSTFSAPVIMNGTLEAVGVATNNGVTTYSNNAYFLGQATFGTSTANTNAQLTTDNTLTVVGGSRKHISMNTTDGTERFAIGLRSTNPYDWCITSASGTDLLDLSIGGNLASNYLLLGNPNSTLFNTYIDYTGFLAFQGPWAATDNPAYNINVTIVGSYVTLHCPQISVTGNNTAAYITSTYALPTYMWPKYQCNWPCLVSSGPPGSLVQSSGIFSITITGIIEIFATPNFGTWTVPSPNQVFITSQYFTYMTPQLNNP